MLNLDTVILEAIFGACCNEATAPSSVKEFICDAFVKGGYVAPECVDRLERILDDTIKQLKKDRFVYVEYYESGEFHFIATNKFAKALHYDFDEVRRLC